MRFLATLTGLLLLHHPGTAADPLLRIPKEANLAIVVEHPRKLVETLRTLDAYESALQLPAVQEALNGTQVRQIFQFIEYYERDLGAPWPELLDRIAGDGIAIGVATGTDPAPALFVAQGRDEETVEKFFTLALDLLEKEIARNAGDAAAPKLRRATYQDFETTHAGEDLHAARVGKVIYVSNREKALHKALDLAKNSESSNSLAGNANTGKGRELIGGEPLAWLWFDLAQVKETPGAKNFFEATRKDILQTVVAGSTIDSVRRADFVVAGLHAQSGGLSFSVRLPAGRSGLPPEFALHVPPTGKPALLPLLKPKGVLYSQSFHLDLGILWTQRAKLFNEQQLKDVEKAEKDISKVLPGTTLGEMLQQVGPYHRFVSVGRVETPYKIQPEQPIPPFALVLSMRDRKFGASATSALRGLGFLAGLQAGVKVSEEQQDDITVVTYRFDENKPLPNDPGNLAFNFEPSFALVGDSLVLSSSKRLVKDLIPELQAKPEPIADTTQVWRATGFADGAATLLRAVPDPTVTQSILSEGVSLEEAKKRTQQIADWLKMLGDVNISIDEQPDLYEFRIAWQPKR